LTITSGESRRAGLPYRLSVRTVGVLLGSLVIVATATASTVVDVTVLPKPGFPPPAKDVSPKDHQLVLLSSRYRSPAELPPALPSPPASAPKRFRGAELQFAIRQRPHVFLVYGGRYLVKASQSYAIDFANFTRPPNGAWLEEIRWAREVDGVLYVEHTHLTYASATRSLNAYISAIDLAKKRTLWRSPALVANARTFVVTGDLIVSGYGFTAEPDFLYLLDRRSGKVLDRLAVPSGPEIIKLRGNRLHVRTYDRQVVARVAGS
jgi:hypothetical protein